VKKLVQHTDIRSRAWQCGARRGQRNDPQYSDLPPTVTVQHDQRDVSKKEDGSPSLPDSPSTRLAGGLEETGLLEALPDVLFVVDGDARLVWGSTRFQKLTGQSEDELCGRPLGELGIEEDPGIQHILERAWTDGTRTTTELRLRTEDGPSIPCTVTGHVVEDQGGAERSVVGIGRDDTGVRSQGEELQRERERLTTLYSGLPSPVVHYRVQDGTAIVRAVNAAFETIFGVSEEDLVGAELDARIAPDEHVPQAESLTRRAVDEGSVQAEVIRETAEGPRYFQLDSVLISATEQPEGFAIYTDITDQKRREQTLRDEQATLRAMYRITANHEADFEQKIQQLIDLGREYLNLPYGFLTRVADGAQQIVQASGTHPLLQAGETCPLSQAYCRKTIEQGSLVAVRDAVAEGWKDDPAYQTFELEAYIGSTVFVEEELYGTFCFAGPDAREAPFTERECTFVELITRWASYELEQKRAQEELERRNERLDSFASLVSHDLRNPLNVAKGRLELVRETEVDSEAEHLAAVGRALDRMDELIADVLALTWGRQATDPDDWVECDLSEMVDTCWTYVDAERANLHLEDPSTIWAEEGRLQQLLENLLRNAVEHGGEAVTIWIGGLEDGFFVEDDGPGIPEEDRDQVFEAGYSSRDEGTGLGLSIVKSIADAHEWEVAVTAGREGGARFEFTGVEVQGRATGPTVDNSERC